MSLSSIDDQVMLHQHPAALLQALLRFDTTNPPGNENACPLIRSLPASSFRSRHSPLPPDTTMIASSVPDPPKGCKE